MARTLYTRFGIDQAVGFEAASYEKSASYASAAASSLTVSPIRSTIPKLVYCTDLSGPAHNSATWPTSANSYSVDVTATSNASSTANNVGLYRLSSDGSTYVDGGNATGLNLSTTGIKTGSFTFNYNDSGSPATSDVATMRIYVVGSTSHSDGSVTFDDSDTFLTLTDFTAPSTTPRVVDRQRRALQAVSRASVW